MQLHHFKYDYFPDYLVHIVQWDEYSMVLYDYHVFGDVKIFENMNQIHINFTFLLFLCFFGCSPIPYQMHFLVHYCYMMQWKYFFVYKYKNNQFNYIIVYIYIILLLFYVIFPLIYIYIYFF